MKLQTKSEPSATRFRPQIMRLYFNFTVIILHSIPSPYLPPGSNISMKKKNPATSFHLLLYIIHHLIGGLSAVNGHKL